MIATIKKLLGYIMLFALISNLVACKKETTDEENTQRFEQGAIIKLDALKALYTYKPVTLGDNKITGVVISSPVTKNIDSNYVVIQDKGYGITLSMAASLAATYATGDSLVINVNNAVLTNVLGTNLVQGLTPAQISKVATGKVVAPLTITLAGLSAAFARYEATLVRVLNTNIKPDVATEIYYKGIKSLDDISGASTVKMYTRTSATFADSLLPSGATFIAIPVLYNAIGENTSAWAEKRLLVRRFTEVSPVVVITGWQFGVPASLGTEASYNATTTAVNTNVASLSRGSGFNPSSLGRGFSSNAALATVSKDDAIANNACYQFAVSAKPGYSLSFAGLTCRLRRSGAGANAFCVMYSLNGTTFTQVGNDVGFTSTDDAGTEQPPTDMSSTPALQNIAPGTTVTFRLYGWGFGNIGSGSFAIGRYASGVTTNLLTVSGNVQ